jgi:uncharacterized membrane protein YdbT with pleckstrin-like domain
MAFPRKLLAEHEQIVFDLRPHWVALALPTVFTLLIVVATVLLYNLPADPSAKWENGVVIVALIAFFFLGLLPFLNWLYTNFVLTTDRLITRKGIIAKQAREIPLERINDVTFNQSILDRALGAGSLLIESAGERGQTKISHVRHPEQVQLEIYKETEKNNDRMMRPAPQVGENAGLQTGARSGSGTSVTAEIEALARLRDQGAITEAEYDSKKQELLKRL